MLKHVGFTGKAMDPLGSAVGCASLTQRHRQFNGLLLLFLQLSLGVSNRQCKTIKTGLEEHKSRSQEFGKFWQYMSSKRTAFTKCCRFDIRAACWSEFLGSASTLSLSCLQLFCPQQLNKAYQERNKRRGMPTTWLDESW